MSPKCPLVTQSGERPKISCTSLRERGPDWGQWQTRCLERGQRAKVVSMRHQSDRPMKPSAKVISTALLLIGCASTASAQGYWYYGDYGLKQRGYYGTPYGGGPQYGSGGGDQYGYGPAYSYAKQAPEPSPFAPTPCVWRRVWNEHH